MLSLNKALISSIPVKSLPNLFVVVFMVKVNVSKKSRTGLKDNLYSAARIINVLLQTKVLRLIKNKHVTYNSDKSISSMSFILTLTEQEAEAFIICLCSVLRRLFMAAEWVWGDQDRWMSCRVKKKTKKKRRSCEMNPSEPGFNPLFCVQVCASSSHHPVSGRLQSFLREERVHGPTPHRETP